MSRRKLSKVVILGDSAVGKTSLLHAYVEEKFVQSHKATVGADFMEREVVVDGKVINLQIWDTAGQERFRAMGSAFYRGSDCCVLVYDISDKKSFENIESWITEFITNGNPKEPQKFPFILIGNKMDLQETRMVDSGDVRQFLAKHPNIKHFQTSAKNKEGVSQVFSKIALASIQNKQQEIFNVYVDSKHLIKIDKNQKNKKVCC